MEVVNCEHCDSDGHMGKHCWIAHGVRTYNRRLPPPVAEQYKAWNAQFTAGTYVKTVGGPPWVRIQAKPRPEHAYAAEVDASSADEEEAAMNYCANGNVASAMSVQEWLAKAANVSANAASMPWSKCVAWKPWFFGFIF